MTPTRSSGQSVNGGIADAAGSARRMIPTGSSARRSMTALVNWVVPIMTQSTSSIATAAASIAAPMAVTIPE